MFAHKECLRKKLKENSKGLVFFTSTETNTCFCEKCKERINEDLIIEKNILPEEEKTSLLFKRLQRSSTLFKKYIAFNCLRCLNAIKISMVVDYIINNKDTWKAIINGIITES